MTVGLADWIVMIWWGRSLHDDHRSASPARGYAALLTVTFKLIGWS